jgi:hypothetical protein
VRCTLPTLVIAAGRVVRVVAVIRHAYLGRYTHRVAISNRRLIDMPGEQVRFRWRDYRHHNKSKVMTLAADEFIRRFLLTPCRTAFTASVITVFSAIVIAPRNPPSAAG